MSRGRVLGLGLVIGGLLLLVVGIGVMTGDADTGLPVAGLGAGFLVAGGGAVTLFKPRAKEAVESKQAVPPKK